MSRRRPADLGGWIRRTAFACAVSASSVLLTFALWGGREHPRAELGIGGWIWLWCSAVVILASPLWALIYPLVARAGSFPGWLLRAAGIVAAATAFAYGVGALGFLLF